MKRYVCAVDLGTTAIKAALADSHGSIAAVNSHPSPRVGPGDGRFNPDAYFRRVCKTLRGLLAGVPGPGSRVEAVSVSSQRSTTLLIDSRSKPLGPALSWQGTDCAAAADNFYLKFGTERFEKITGLPPGPIYSAAKLAHQAICPDSLSKAVRIVTLHDWILTCLGASEFLTDHSNASATGLYDIRRRIWSEDIITALGLDTKMMPEIVPAGTPAGRVSAEAAGKTGLPEGTPIITGAGDQQCAAMGAGGTEGDCILSSGTSAALLLPLSRLPSPSPRGFLLLAHAPHKQYILEGFMSTFGSCVAWAAKNLRVGGAVGLEKLALVSKPDSRIIFLPFLAGSGSPDHNPSARGIFAGLDLTASAAGLARAVFTGLACEANRILDSLRKSVPVKRLILVGGGADSAIFPELLADLSGLPVVIPEKTEAALLGAAALAWSGIQNKTIEAILTKNAYKTSRNIIPSTDARNIEVLYSEYLKTLSALHPPSERNAI
jgi:xylulokinase